MRTGFLFLITFTIMCIAPRGMRAQPASAEVSCDCSRHDAHGGPACGRMTLYPAARVPDDNVCGFLHRYGYALTLSRPGQIPHVCLYQGEASHFWTVQCPDCMWSTATAPDSLLVTINARRVSAVGNPADTLFFVEVRARGNTTMHRIAFTVSQFVLNPMTWEATCAIPWGSNDAPDVDVQWTGKSDAEFTWLRVQTRASWTWFNTPHDTGAGVLR
jgi:hypothetical protein